MVTRRVVRREYMKKTAIPPPNYPDGGKNRPVVEMLLPGWIFCGYGWLFLPVLRNNEKIPELVEIAPVENTKPLGI
jgi:hypothetical protein